MSTGATIDEPERHLPRRTALEAFFLEDGALARVPAGAAEWPRPARRTPALRVQDALPGDVVLAAHAPESEHALADVGRQVLRDELAHLDAESDVFCRFAEIHGRTSLSAR